MPLGLRSGPMYMSLSTPSSVITYFSFPQKSHKILEYKKIRDKCILNQCSSFFLFLKQFHIIVKSTHFSKNINS